MSTKFSILLALICFLQPHLFVNGRNTDWEVLNFAITDPGKSNPEVLKDAILNIVGDFFTTQATTAAPTTTPCPGATTTKAPCGCSTTTTTTTPKPCKHIPNWPSNIKPPWIDWLSQQQQVQPAAASKMQYSPNPPAPYVNTHNFLHAANIPHRHGSSGPVHHQHKPDCDCGPNKLAEFDVNIPCPKSTPKPKPIREIIVKVPCPTTKKPECECQCCPCNPCKNKPTKRPKPSRTTRKRSTTKRPKPTRTTKPPKESCSSESSEVVHKSYQQYHPRGKYEKVFHED
jgi:hypothetical protein